MSKSVNKLLHKNHNTISDLTNTSKSILNAALDENKHSTEKLKTACVSLTSILDRLKFLRRYVSNVYIDKEKKKYRSIYHLFKENKIVKEISYDNIKELIENEDDYHLYDLNHHIWDHTAEVSKIPKNTCYSLWLNKNNNNAQITSEDDVKIIKCVKRIDDWIAFGSYMQKAPFLLFKRYKQFVQQIKRDLWIKIEDIKLTEAVNQYGAGKWTLIANYVGTKNPKQCMHRYRNKLVEGIRTGKWTLEEDSKLKEGVSIFGVGKWSRISEHVGTRNDSQCRERYCNILDPSIKKGKWTMEEDRQLLAIVIYVGEGNWSYISTKIHGRTDAQCRRRYKFLKKIK